MIVEYNLLCLKYSNIVVLDLKIFIEKSVCLAGAEVSGAASTSTDTSQTIHT